MSLGNMAKAEGYRNPAVPCITLAKKSRTTVELIETQGLTKVGIWLLLTLFAVTLASSSTHFVHLEHNPAQS